MSKISIDLAGISIEEIIQIRDECNRLLKNKEKPLFPINPNSVLPDEYIPHVELWLTHKREKGQSYKVTGFKILCKKLLVMTSGNAEYAKACIEESISNNYSGIFPAKTNSNGSLQKESQFDKEVRESYEQAARRFTP